MRNTSVVKRFHKGVVGSSNLRTLIDNTNDLMWSVDRDFKLIACNRAFQEKAESVSGEQVNKVSDALAISLQLMTFYKRAFLGESFVEIEYTTDPVENWLEISISPILKGDEVIGTSCYSRDITIIKQEEHRLKLLESVVSNATDAVLITEASPLDGAGPKIVYVNDALIKMTGYTRAEIIGKTPAMLQGPKTDKDELDRSVKCLANSEPCEIEIVNYKKNGDEFRMHIAIAPVAQSNGQSTHFISIGRDVTERHKNVEAIKKQNKKLRTIAWVQSHDLRGPLARIKGLVNLLCNNSHPQNDMELIGHLRSASNELDDVVRKIVTATEEVPGFRQTPILSPERGERFK